MSLEQKLSDEITELVYPNKNVYHASMAMPDLQCYPSWNNVEVIVF